MQMQRVLKWVIIGVVLDLAVAGVLSFLAIREDQNRIQLQQQERISQCWDNVLAKATLNQHPTPQTQEATIKVALACVKLAQR